MTKEGLRTPNYWGSLTQAATCRVGNYKGEEVFTPFKSLLPMVAPNDIVLGGWDISNLNLADAMERAKVIPSLTEMINVHRDNKFKSGYRCWILLPSHKRPHHHILCVDSSFCLVKKLS